MIWLCRKRNGLRSLKRENGPRPTERLTQSGEHREIGVELHALQAPNAERGESVVVLQERAKVERTMRPFHDGRHMSITNAAAAGVSPAALMARAGHSDFKTTQGYIDLAGETFREEAELADERMFGPVDQESGQKSAHE